MHDIENTESFDLRRRLANEVLGAVEWEGENVGFCVCPGAETHSSSSGPRDCRVNIDGTPSVFCFHQSCTAHLVETNKLLREAIREAEVHALFKTSSRRLAPRSLGERNKARQRRQEQVAAEQACMALPQIISDYAWKESVALETSPILIEGPPENQTKLFLRTMFNPENIVWIGRVFDSGKPEHSNHFRSVSEWLTCDRLSMPFTCTSTFLPGVSARRSINVQSQPYIVLEGDYVDAGCAAKKAAGKPLNDSDKARNRAACLAVLNWLRVSTSIVLRAIVDAGNKSMHGWCDQPDSATMKELRLVLPSLGFDTSVLRSTQPVRLAGVRRPESGVWQRLIYLNPPTSEDCHAERH